MRRIVALPSRFGLAVALSTLAACAPTRFWSPRPGVPLEAVLVSQGGDTDMVSTLVDGRVEATGWYCVANRGPARFEVMTADGRARRLRAVAFVPGNLGPDGIGRVDLRVQHGHGVAAEGEQFSAEFRAPGDRLHVMRLPDNVSGSHVVLSMSARSEWRTSACVGEVVLYEESVPTESDGAVVADATPSGSTATPASH